MSLRRSRSHRAGVSNIDFRSKKDEENLKIFDPWLFPQDTGTIGYKTYKNSFKIMNNLNIPTEKMHIHKNIVNNYPDPRYYTTSQFYKNNNIRIKTKSFIDSTRMRNLKETFNGENGKITKFIKQEKGKKTDSYLLKKKKKQTERLEKLYKDKKRLNLNAFHETQLVQLDTSLTLNNLINIKKIEEINQVLRRRYRNIKSINKTFHQWAQTIPNKITINDAYKMINSLSIPINFNEAKIFIFLASKTGKDFINLEEFSDLIFSENTKVNSSQNILSNKKIIFDEKEVNDLKNQIINNNKNINDKNNINILKNFISQRIIALIKNMKELNKEKINVNIDNNNNNYNLNNVGNFFLNINKCNYDKFLKGILSLKPGEIFGKEEYIKTIFDEYKDKNNLIDIKNFCDNIYEKNNKEHFFTIKDVSKEQLTQKKETLQKFISDNKKYRNLIFDKKKDLNKQILLKNNFLEKEKKEEKKQLEQVNCTVPSKMWLHHIFDNREEHFNILNKAERALSAKPNLRGISGSGSTRFGASPQWKNTADILIGDKSSSAYINEKDRFIINRDIGKDDKIKKEKLNIGRKRRIRSAIQRVAQNNYIKQLLKDEKEIYSNYERYNRMIYYEESIKNKNMFFE